MMTKFKSSAHYPIAMVIQIDSYPAGYLSPHKPCFPYRGHFGHRTHYSDLVMGSIGTIILGAARLLGRTLNQWLAITMTRRALIFYLFMLTDHYLSYIFYQVTYPCYE